MRFERIEAFKKGILKKFAEEDEHKGRPADKSLAKSSSSTSSSSKSSHTLPPGDASNSYFRNVPPYRARKERAALTVWCNTPTNREAFGINEPSLSDHGSVDEDRERMSDDGEAQVEVHPPEAGEPVTASKCSIPTSDSLVTPNEPGAAVKSNRAKDRDSVAPGSCCLSLIVPTARIHSHNSSPLVTRDKLALQYPSMAEPPSRLSSYSGASGARCGSDQARLQSSSKRASVVGMSDEDDMILHADENVLLRSDGCHEAKRARLQ